MIANALGEVPDNEIKYIYVYIFYLKILNFYSDVLIFFSL